MSSKIGTTLTSEIDHRQDYALSIEKMGVRIERQTDCLGANFRRVKVF